MNLNNQSTETFDENQSFRVIREMIQVSKRKLKHDSILFILWGWIMTLHYLILYALRTTAMTSLMQRVLNYMPITLIAIGVILTIYYIYKQRKKVQTYIGISLRYIWISMFACLVLVNLILFNVLHKINFELQHPIFMVLIAFAIVATGGIMRYRLIVTGGIIFGVLAFLCSYLSLTDQLFIEAVAWLISFVIPGHLLYSRRKS